MEHNKHIKHININIHKINELYMTFKINEYIILLCFHGQKEEINLII